MIETYKTHAHSDTYGNLTDMIQMQDAINKVNELYRRCDSRDIAYYHHRLIEELGELPPAQPQHGEK